MMDENVPVTLTIGPWDPQQLASTEAGQQLLEAIKKWGFDTSI
jgi:hypothetical protein